MLADWGWNEAWAAALAATGAGADELPARVSGQDRDRWVVQHAGGAAVARIAGNSYMGPLPVTGDWITVRPGPSPSDPLSVIRVLPRRSAISRGSAGTGVTEQVLATNVDLIWIIHALDVAPNPRRLERLLAAAWDTGATPEIVLTKADLAEDVGAAMSQVRNVAFGVDVHAVSVHAAESIQQLRGRLKFAHTVALLGASGAGKSTLVNALAGSSLAATAEVRASDRKGRHTTTRRELFPIPGGALLMDTPGLREFRVWSLDEGLSHAFPEIDELAASCRFRDCQHDAEPGCAVLAAVQAGEIEPERLASYRKLRAEAAYHERKTDPQAQAAAVAQHKTALKTLKYHPKYRRQD